MNNVRTISAHQSSSLSWGTKLGWASGSFGVAVLMNGISSLILFYMTIVLKFDPMVAGMIIFLSKIYDAVSDPFSGWLSDRSKSKKGRRRPFLFWGALVSAISFLLVFHVPFSGPYADVSSGEGLKAAAYTLFVLILYTTGYSMFNVPYMAMPAEMTQDFHERSSIHGYRVVISAIGGLLVQAGGGVLLDKLGKDADGFGMIGMIGAALIYITMMISYWATAKAPSIPQNDTKLTIREQIQGFMNNKPFQIVLAIKLVQLIGVASAAGALVFFLATVLNRPLSQMAALGGAMIVAVMLATPALLWLSRRIGKKAGYAISAVITGIVALSWIWATPDEHIIGLALRGAGSGIAFAGNVMFAMSMLTDTMEADALQTGMRREGVYSALYSFVEKLSSAIGPLILGSALSYAGFNAEKPPEVVDEGVRQAVLLGIAYVPAAMAVLALILLKFYKLDERALELMRQKAA